MRLALNLAGDERSHDEALVDQLQTDPRLTLGMLAGANLPLMAGSRPVKTVRQAVANLGRCKCLSLLWLVALSDFLRAWPHLPERARQKLWRHSLLTGVLAQELLSAAGPVAIGDGLAAGMAHDIGHLLLSGPGARLGIVWHEEHELVVERKDLSPAPERDHCRLGAALLAFWEAAPEMVACALHHHEPTAALAPHVPLIAGVRLADLLAEHLDLDRPARPLRLESSPAWQELAAIEPWVQIPHLHLVAIERLPEAVLAAEHLANLLGT
jgi:HD-like signal output (HDOD) protein